MSLILDTNTIVLCGV